MHRPAAMANLLGDLWAKGEPDWRAACAFPGVKLHLYGKSDPRPGRKMGHLVAFGGASEEAAHRALAARTALLKSASPIAAKRKPAPRAHKAAQKKTAAQKRRRGYSFGLIYPPSRNTRNPNA